MAHERDPSEIPDSAQSLIADEDTSPAPAPIVEDEPSVAELRRTLAGPLELQRPFGAWLLGVVDREVRITLGPIARQYRRDLRGEAEDLAHDVLVLLLCNGGRVLLTWDPARGMRLRSFIGLVVRRYIYRRFRGFRGNPWSSNPMTAEIVAARLDEVIAADPSRHAVIEYRLELDTILQVLEAELNERSWRLFSKLYVDQRTPADVGAEEGMRENSVHKWISRLQQWLRRRFPQSPMPGGKG